MSKPVAALEIVSHCSSRRRFLPREGLAWKRSARYATVKSSSQSDRHRQQESTIEHLAPWQNATLPFPRTRLIGRLQERGAARALLLDDNAALVTLVGTGGVGKTRLVLDIGADVGTQFSDGVIWVDFSALDSTVLVPATVARAANVPTTTETSIADDLVRRLAPRQALLVLDNCEHLLAEVAMLVARLLAACPGLQVLATSRAPLRVRGEVELPVEPLALPASRAESVPAIAQFAAIELFVERTRAVRPGFTIDATNAATIAAICQRLDGLPLAIELAAARCKVLSPAMLLAHLEEGFQLLGGGTRDAPARQQTIFDTIAWSFDLLRDSEQRLFRRLGVFAGGFTLDEARAIAGSPDDDVLAGLFSLVDNSLVRQREQADGSPRFTILETIRTFAREQLQHDEEANAIHRAHAGYFLKKAEDHTDHLFFATDPLELDALEAALDNTRAALNWLLEHGDAESCLRLATAYGWLWFIRGPFPEGRRWLDLARDESLLLSDRVRGRALMWASDIALRQNDYNASLPMSAQSVKLLRDLPDAGIWLAASLINLACTYHTFVDGDRTAIPLLEEALAVARRLENSLISGVVYNNLAEFAIDRGAYEAAEAYLAEAAALQGRLPYAWGAPYSSLSHGVVALERGDHRGAMKHFIGAMTAALDHGDTSFVRSSCMGAALVAERIEACDLAATLFAITDRLQVNSGGHQYVWLQKHGEISRQNIDARRQEQNARQPITSSCVPDYRSPLFEIDDVITQLHTAIAMAERGAHDPSHVQSARESPAPPYAHISAEQLTYREHDVLALLCQRLTNYEMAQKLFVSPRTVESHVSRAC